MINRKDVSIIIPIYNASKYLKRCLDSIINQTKTELEIILINDGSTDNSEEIIKEYKDKRIRYFKNKNQGIGKTRNFGIAKATGKYIMFLDSDDFLDKHACKTLFDKAFSNSLDMVICDFYIKKGQELEKESLLDFKPTTLKSMPILAYEVNLAPWNKLYKTDFLKENNIKFIENLKYEDAPFVLEAMDKANKIGKVNKYLNYYVINEKSETTIRDARVFDIIKIIEIIRRYFSDKKYMQDIIDKLTVRILMNYNIQECYQSDKKIAMKFISDSFDYLKLNVPNYKKSSYFKERGVARSIIEKHEFITKLYCLLYISFRREFKK